MEIARARARARACASAFVERSAQCSVTTASSLQSTRTAMLGWLCKLSVRSEQPAEQPAELGLSLPELPDDCLRALALHLDVPSLVSLSLTCRSLHELLGNDDVWKARAAEWGAPHTPADVPARRFFAREVYVKRQLPLPPDCVSRYRWGGEYACTVTRAVQTRRGLELTISARGDGTLGALQPAAQSVLGMKFEEGRALQLTSQVVVVSGTPVTTDAVDCTLVYKQVPRVAQEIARGGGVAFSFVYGQKGGGYDGALLFAMNRAFVDAHHLGHLLGR